MSGGRFSRKFVRSEQLLHAVSGCTVRGNRVVSSGVNLSDRIRINSLSLSGLVTTRSERNSCNSYEHEY